MIIVIKYIVKCVSSWDSEAVKCRLNWPRIGWLIVKIILNEVWSGFGLPSFVLSEICRSNCCLPMETEKYNNEEPELLLIMKTDVFLFVDQYPSLRPFRNTFSKISKKNRLKQLVNNYGFTLRSVFHPVANPVYLLVLVTRKNSRVAHDYVCHIYIAKSNSILIKKNKTTQRSVYTVLNINRASTV